MHALLGRVHPRRDRLLVAFSGGLDSTVLLDAVVRWSAGRAVEVRALHVDHGLHADSAAWSAHCVAFAARLRVPCAQVRLVPTRVRGESVEAWARTARYGALRARADERTCVLTAHHADDQAETVLYRALQGAGPHGLAAVRALVPFGRACLARPLLGVSRASLAACARERGLSWIEDPSNRDPAHPRNRLRHDVLPALEQAVPGAARGLARLGAIQAELAAMLDTLADGAIDGAPRPPWRLPVAAVTALPEALRPYVLKRWLARAGFPVPGARHVREILARVVTVRPDGAPRVSWAGCELRRYDGDLWIFSCPRALPAGPLAWSPPAALELPVGCLRTRAVTGRGLGRRALADGAVSVRWRAGGERFVPAGRGVTRPLKKLFQEWRVPPWERPYVPLVYVGERLAAVAGRCVADGFAAAPGEPALELTWDNDLYRQGG